MELRARTQRLADPEPPTAMPPVTEDTALISGLENDAQTHLFLRGVMCFLALLAYLLSAFQIENYAATTVLHVIILLLSLAGAACLYEVYRIKARFSGFTNPAVAACRGRGRRPAQVTPFHSPYLGHMCLEVALWLLQCPPGVPAGAVSNALDSFILLRSYVFVMYFSQLSGSSLFKRSIAALCGSRFDSSSLVGHRFLHHGLGLFMLPGFVAMWLCLALLHAKAEAKGFGESLYFCVSTATFVGFGGGAPRTLAGRISACFSFCLGGVMLAWCVVVLHNATRLSPPERSLHTLFEANRLCAAMPNEAARVIQRAWKLYVAKKENRISATVQLNAFRLTARAASFRRLRRGFAAAELRFLRSTLSPFERALASTSSATGRRREEARDPGSLRQVRTACGGGAGSEKVAGTVYERIDRVENQLDNLILRAQRLARAVAEGGSSPAEPAS